MLNQVNMQIARNTSRITDFGIGSGGKKGQFQNSKYTYMATRAGEMYKGSARYISIFTGLEPDRIADVASGVVKRKNAKGWKITRFDN